MKKTAVLLMSSVTLGGFILPTVTTFAAEEPQQEVSTVQEQADISVADLYEGSEFHSVEVNGDTTTVSITDKQLVDYLDSQGTEVPKELRIAAMARKQGVTKIVWYGAAKNGSFSVYLSANTMNSLQNSWLTAQGLISLLALYAAPSPATAIAAANRMIALIKQQGVKNGRIYKFSGWRYSSSSLQ